MSDCAKHQVSIPKLIQNAAEHFLHSNSAIRFSPSQKERINIAIAHPSLAHCAWAFLYTVWASRESELWNGVDLRSLGHMCRNRCYKKCVEPWAFPAETRPFFQNVQVLVFNTHTHTGATLKSENSGIGSSYNFSANVHENPLCAGLNRRCRGVITPSLAMTRAKQLLLEGPRFEHFLRLKVKAQKSVIFERSCNKESLMIGPNLTPIPTSESIPD